MDLLLIYGLLYLSTWVHEIGHAATADLLYRSDVIYTCCKVDWRLKGQATIVLEGKTKRRMWKEITICLMGPIMGALFFIVVNQQILDPSIYISVGIRTGILIHIFSLSLWISEEKSDGKLILKHSNITLSRSTQILFDLILVVGATIMVHLVI
jgi:hypothetical protein